ncbi:MAG: histidine kinase N-terminal domain-containing protein, partial [Actinobacteria bacterium]|nr:histidine kinase N-terminal domain-containing protein [Actinomycetota bacterium]
MPTLTDLAHRAGIRGADLDWLHALISDWQLLADLSFADLVLWAPLVAEDGAAQNGATEGGAWPDGASWIALAQMRPTTAPTALPDDIVGMERPGSDQPYLAEAFHQGRVCREGDPDWSRGVPIRHETIPVTRAGRVLAAIER